MWKKKLTISIVHGNKFNKCRAWKKTKFITFIPVYRVKKIKDL